jgi:hypothetical protein
MNHRSIPPFISTLIFSIFIVVIATAQTNPEQTPEATPEVTSEATDVFEEDAACPALVQQALTITQTGCDGTDRNEICYGHLLLDAQLRAGLSETQFTDPGDTVDVVSIDSVSLSAMDTIAGIWGVILMQIQANLETESQEDVTFVVFGDTALENAAHLLPVIANEPVNIRSEPSTEGDILASLATGDKIIASGQTEDGDWLRIQLSGNGAISVGWVSTDFVTTDGNFEDLEIVSPEDDGAPATDDQGATFGPMQAFYFQSGKDDSPCAEAPNSGLLIQTPEGEASVSLWIDEVVIELNATAFVQAQPNGDITVNVLDGLAQVTSNGETRTAVAGTQISVPIDAELAASDVPDDPVPFDANDVQSLPIQLLPNQVEIPAPLNLGAGVPLEGNWRFSWGVNSLTCPDGTVVPFESVGGLSAISIEDEGESLIWNGQYTRSSAGVYMRVFVDGEGNLHQDTLNVVAIDRISGEKVVDFADIVCTLTVPFQLQLVSPVGSSN